MQALGGMRSRSMLLVIALLVAHAGTAQQARSIFETERACKASKGSLRADDLTVLDFRIGVSTIGDVQKHFPGTSPVKLTKEEEAEEGVCIKNAEGQAVVFATGVMGAPMGRLTTIYLAPVKLAERSGLTCQMVKLPSKEFSSKSGIRVGITSTQMSKILGGKVPAEGPVCTAYEIPTSQGLLQVNKSEKLKEFTDSTGVEGAIVKGKVKWVGLYGITSN